MLYLQGLMCDEAGGCRDLNGFFRRVCPILNRAQRIYEHRMPPHRIFPDRFRKSAAIRNGDTVHLPGACF